MIRVDVHEDGGLRRTLARGKRFHDNDLKLNLEFLHFSFIDWPVDNNLLPYLSGHVHRTSYMRLHCSTKDGRRWIVNTLVI